MDGVVSFATAGGPEATGCTSPDIGIVMGKSEGAIKLLIHRGMIGLRARLDITTFDRGEV